MKEAVHVGKTFKQVHNTYKDVKFDFDGWADAEKFLPEDFDLCLLKTERETIPGWYCGNSWDGKRLNQGEKVLYWKLKSQE